MKVFVLSAGMMGRAVVHDLAAAREVRQTFLLLHPWAATLRLLLLSSSSARGWPHGWQQPINQILGRSRVFEDFPPGEHHD